MRFFLIFCATISLLFSCTTDDNSESLNKTKNQSRDITGENIVSPPAKDSIVIVKPPKNDTVVVVKPPVKETIVKPPVDPVVEEPVDPIVVDPPVIENPIKECIYTLPDAQGGDTGKGFTCTGLCYDIKESENLNNSLIFWVGNHGSNRQSATNTYFTSSLVKIQININVKGKAEAQKLVELDMSKITNNGTIQGVVADKFNTLWIVSFGNVINVTKSGAEISRFYVKGANGLAYDAVNDYFFVKCNKESIIRVVNKSGNAIKNIEAYASIDQMFYDASNKILYGGFGSNGKAGKLKSYDVETGEEIATYGTYANVLASEGVSIVGDYLYYASDAYYHPAPIPSLEINAIHKIYFKP
jgi:hypothetical protein